MEFYQADGGAAEMGKDEIEELARRGGMHHFASTPCGIITVPQVDVHPDFKWIKVGGNGCGNQGSLALRGRTPRGSMILRAAKARNIVDASPEVSMEVAFVAASAQYGMEAPVQKLAQELVTMGGAIVSCAYNVGESGPDWDYKGLPDRGFLSGPRRSAAAAIAMRAYAPSRRDVYAA